MALPNQVTNDEYRKIGNWLLKHKANELDEQEQQAVEKFLDLTEFHAEEAQLEIEREAAEEIDLGHFNFGITARVEQRPNLPKLPARLGFSHFEINEKDAA